MNINPLDILKNAKMIQEQMGNFQDKLGAIKVTGTSGGGMAEVDLNGRMDVLALRISDEAMEDREMLQDLIVAAFNNAMEKVREKINSEMGGMIPGMQGLK
ncbi:MAG: YbaB/EbfC family nucleoid-associated protein [Treponema sp.]|nr:YbaB/EbfC family nucleoid-associated protein [Treponema sp.]